MSAVRIPAATVVAAARPRSFMPVSTWQDSQLRTHSRCLLRDSAERLAGAAYAIHGVCSNMEETRRTALMFVADGLLDQAHVLKAAVQAQKDAENAEEAADEARRAKRAKKRGGGK